MVDDDDDELDGLCEEDLQPEPTSDEDIDGIVLYADIAGQDLEVIAKRKAEWEELFGAS
jgi:hypothetical protein